MPAMSKQIQLPADMVEKYINMYCDRPIKLSNGNTNCECPVCREGKSHGHKRRMYYFPEENYIYCFNCNKYWSPVKWISEIAQKPIKDIIKEASSYSYFETNKSVTYFNSSNDTSVFDQQDDSVLPEDAIVLNSQLQKMYYSGNKVIELALAFIKNRRLDTAVNVPKYSISLKDKIHKNRLIIPFTDLDGSIPFYQTRKLFENDFLPKYLSKRDSEKTCFGIDKIDINYPYIFITEGPIDSCFIKNGVSLAGLKYTDRQIEQLSEFFTHERIWVLDNDFRTNPTVMAQYEKLISEKERIFIWPDSLIKYKDINEYCIGEQKDQFNSDFLIENSYNGLRATQILKGLK